MWTIAFGIIIAVFILANLDSVIAILGFLLIIAFWAAVIIGACMLFIK